MKRNLTLFSFLIALLLVTYFVQEKGAERSYQMSLTQDRLITGPITQLEINQIKLEKKGDQWFAGETLLSHNSMKQLEKKLGEIKKIKDVNGDWKNYFPHPISLQVNQQTLTFGEMSLEKDGFYVALDKKIYLAVIEGESTELTNNEKEIPQIKFRELASLLAKEISELKENQLFRFYPRLPLGQVFFKIEGHLDYELDLIQNTTTPPPIKGIEVHEKQRDKLSSLLTQMTIKEEIPYSPQLKFKQMGMIRFENKGQSVVWELWLKNAKSADPILIDEAQKKAYLMIGGTLKPFFLQVQDYWDKKVIPPSKFQSFNKLTLTFTQGDRAEQVQMVNSEPIRFEATKYKVNIEKMNELILYLFNLGPRDQADRVSQLSSSERKQFLSQEHLKVEVLGEEIFFWNKPQELILINLTQGFKAHFISPDKTMEFNFKDVLE